MKRKCHGIFGLKYALDEYLKMGHIVFVVKHENDWYTIEVNIKEV